MLEKLWCYFYSLVEVDSYHSFLSEFISLHFHICKKKGKCIWIFLSRLAKLNDVMLEDYPGETSLRIAHLDSIIYSMEYLTLLWVDWPASWNLNKAWERCLLSCPAAKAPREFSYILDQSLTFTASLVIFYNTPLSWRGSIGRMLFAWWDRWSCYFFILMFSTGYGRYQILACQIFFNIYVIFDKLFNYPFIIKNSGWFRTLVFDLITLMENLVVTHIKCHEHKAFNWPCKIRTCSFYAMIFDPDFPLSITNIFIKP